MIRVLVAEDSPTSRALLVAILSSDPEIQVVGEAVDGVRGGGDDAQAPPRRGDHGHPDAAHGRLRGHQGDHDRHAHADHHRHQQPGGRRGGDIDALPAPAPWRSWKSRPGPTLPGFEPLAQQLHRPRQGAVPGQGCPALAAACARAGGDSRRPTRVRGCRCRQQHRRAGRSASPAVRSCRATFPSPSWWCSTSPRALPAGWPTGSTRAATCASSWPRTARPSCRTPSTWPRTTATWA